MSTNRSRTFLKQTAGFLLLSGALYTTSAYAAHNVNLLSDNQGWKLQVDGKDFFVKGVVWGYTPRDENFTYNLWGQPDDFIQDVLDYEFGLMQKAGINAIRTFMMIPPKWVEYVYKNYGIMTAVNPLMGRYGATINGTWVENTDYSDPATRRALKQEALDVVARFKDTPGVLMFAFGNESNYGLSWESFEIENLPVGEQNKAKAKYLYTLFDEVIDEGRKIAPNYPFTIVNGDIQYLDLIAQEGDDWDLLGVNAYRGKSFTNLWSDVKTKYNKPVLFFEFGADAFNSKEFKEDERSQAEYLKAQWEEIYRKAYGNGAEGNALGGFVFEWRDEWWKFKQTENLNTQDKNASWSNGGYKYDFQENANNMSEEWWGINRLGKANSDGVYLAETRLALDVLTEIWKLNPYQKSTTTMTYSSIDMDALADYRAKNAERSDSLVGNEYIKMTGARIKAESITKALGGPLKDKGIDGTSTDTGVMGFANFRFEPDSNLSGGFTLNYLASAADSDFEFRYGDRIIDQNDPKLEIYDFEATYHDERFNLDLFYHTPRYHWGYEGDFFGLVRETTDMTGPNGQDIWNAKAPFGFEFNGKGALDGLTILAGPQVYWGANPKVITRYRFGERDQYSIMHSQDISRATEADGSDTTKRKEAQTTIQAEFDVTKSTKLQIGAIASGRDKVGESYDYVDNGEVKTDEIESKDTFGVKARLEHSLTDSTKLIVSGQYAGLVADAGDPLVEFGTKLPYSGLGNKVTAEVGLQMNHGDFMIYPRLFARDNLIGANNNSGIIRNTEDDPFAVLGNRKVRAAELMLTYDPTPATPFYDWDNDLREDAKLAFNVGLTYMDYGWTTDAYRAYFVDEFFEGEAAFASGLESDQLWLLSSKIVYNPSNQYRAVLRVDLGKEQTTGAPVEATSFKSIEAKLIYNNRHIVTANAAQDKWGPYDFQRQFGIVYPEQYKLSYTYLLDKGVKEENSSKVGVKVFYRSLDENSPEYGGDIANGDEYKNFDMYEVQTFIEYHF